MPLNHQSFLFRLVFVLIAICLLGYLIILSKTLLAPMLFALLMAFLMLPLTNYMERKTHRRSLSAILTVTLMLFVVYGIGHFFALQLSELWADWPLLVKQVTGSFHDLQQWISEEFHVNISKQETYLADNVEKLLSNSTVLITSTLSALSSSLLFIAFALLFTFFFLNYRRLLYQFIIEVFASDHRNKVVATIGEIQDIIKKYITGLFLQMLLVSILMILTLSILGVKYAILLGLIAGIFNVIPYLGISFAMIISVLISFATAGAAKSFFVFLAFAGIHTIDGNIIMPLIVGSKVKINALIAFVGIVLGEMIWGIQGMFLCMPYLAIMKIIFKKVESLQPWAILLDEEEHIKATPKKRNLFRLFKIKKKTDVRTK